MPNGQVRWTLVFTAPSLEHLAERNVEPGDIVDAVYGRHGPARVRRMGRGARQRWFVAAPLEGGELLTCVLRAALPRDLKARGAFVVPAAGLPEPPGKFDSSMRLCISARLSDQDEIKAIAGGEGAKGVANAYGSGKEAQDSTLPQ